MSGPGERTRGLGRGLSALFGEGEEAEAIHEAFDGETPVASGIATISIARIEANPDQPRKRFSEADLSELAESIAEKGLLQPILVRPIESGARFQVVAGERRWRAAQKARLHDVPVLIRELTDRETLEIAIVENVQRADLNAVEEARAYRQLIENFGHTQQDVAQAVGKSRAHVANTLRLLALPAPVLNRLESGEITAGHARAAAASPDPVALTEQVVAKGLSVRAAEALARSMGAPERKGSARAPSGADKDADTRALESDLAERLGLMVDIRHAGEAGEVRIRYSSLEQLDDLCRRLSARD